MLNVRTVTPHPSVKLTPSPAGEGIRRYVSTTAQRYRKNIICFSNIITIVLRLYHFRKRKFQSDKNLTPSFWSVSDRISIKQSFWSVSDRISLKQSFCSEAIESHNPTDCNSKRAIALIEFNITLKHVLIMHSSLGEPRHGVLDTYNAKAYKKEG